MDAIRVNRNTRVNQVSSRTQLVRSDSNLIDFFIGDKMKRLKCSHCKTIKSELEFSVNRANTFRGGRSYDCLICERRRRKDYLQRNPQIRERINALHRKYYSTEGFKQKRREHYYKTRYCISLDKYEEMLKGQGGVCAICGKDNNHKTQRYLHVDHNHKTGKVRGLLCIRCNTIIGNSKENVDILQRTIEYIYKHLDSV